MPLQYLITSTVHIKREGRGDLAMCADVRYRGGEHMGVTPYEEVSTWG